MMDQCAMSINTDQCAIKFQALIPMFLNVSQCRSIEKYFGSMLEIWSGVDRCWSVLIIDPACPGISDISWQVEQSHLSWLLTWMVWKPYHCYWWLDDLTPSQLPLSTMTLSHCSSFPSASVIINWYPAISLIKGFHHYSFYTAARNRNFPKSFHLTVYLSTSCGK